MNDKDLMKKLSTMANEEIEEEAKRLMDDGMSNELIKPLWEDEMLKEQIANTTDEDRERFRKSWDETVKDLTPNTTDADIEAFRKSLGVGDSWHIEAEIKEKPVERKKRLMRLEKEMLVDMVFNLESRNEFLLHNLSEVEKMYNKLKDRVDELETEVFSLRNQNKLWECIVADYKKREEEFIKEKTKEELQND